MREKKQSNLELALKYALQWLVTASKATSDNGVAQAYFIRPAAWGASYPETTGYIIPTLFDYAELYDDDEFRQISLTMSHWECDVQLPEGAVRAGTVVDAPPRATVFNTGQVLFGWARAFKESRDERFRVALLRAADWLCNVQDEDGCWRKYGSIKTSTAINTYNTRTAWGLIEAFKIIGNERYREAARRNCMWALSQQRRNGWYKNNCLLDNSRPFTHTIAYAMRGFLEVGDFLGEDSFIDAAIRPAKALLKRQREDGSWAGQYNRFWWPKAEWTCCTGNCQLAVNFIRLYEVTQDRAFFEAAARSNRFSMRVQDLTSEDPNIRGGIPGSWPIDGKYHPYQYPNWAAKFFADSLMAELRHWNGE